ncbi:response regulator [Magnetovibrio sp. PR-2]|uniref:response regulator n=1 Tax=Magnetovibrio sp. PR-2 TaxID=3120356 RepID=UPI002FCDE6DC
MSTVLIIDDDNDLRRLIAAYLGSASHTTVEATNGQEGIAQAKASLPDVIILDINMPVMDGTKVIKELRTFEGTAKIPVIALTGMTDTQMRDDMYERGVDAYVTKPIDFPVLLAKVAQLAS